eukprot:10890958-Alexandrium_andersonii.AAC.1
MQRRPRGLLAARPAQLLSAQRRMLLDSVPLACQPELLQLLLSLAQWPGIRLFGITNRSISGAQPPQHGIQVLRFGGSCASENQY